MAQAGTEVRLDRENEGGGGGGVLSMFNGHSTVIMMASERRGSGGGGEGVQYYVPSSRVGFAGLFYHAVDGAILSYYSTLHFLPCFTAGIDGGPIYVAL